MTINERVSPKKPLFAEVHNVPDDYRFTTEELDRIISGDMFTPRQDAIMARELQQYRAAAKPACYALTNSEGEVYNTHSSPENAEAYRMLIHQSDDSLTLRVTPLYAAPQVTSVPDAIEPTYEAIRAILPTANPDEYACCIGADMWNTCRAAMLQGAENSESRCTTKPAPELDSLPKNDESRCSSNQGAKPVSQPYTLPEWLQQAHKLAELHGTSFVVFRHGEEAQCADPTKVIISFTDEGLGHHSAAPQQDAQEVKK